MVAFREVKMHGKLRKSIIIISECMFKIQNYISGLIVNVLSSSVVDHGFEPRLGQTKDHKLIWLILP